MNSLAQGLVEICLTLVSHTLFVEFPILNIPLIRQITIFLIQKVLDILITKTEVGMYMVTIPQNTYEQQKHFVEAIQKNMEIQNNGTPEEKAKAKEDLINRASDFIKFHN